MAEVIVGCVWDSAEPDVYWFGLAVDDGVTSEPIILTPASVVLVERELNPGSWSSDLVLTVAELPWQPGYYAIRTLIPPQIANGQERTIRLTVDGVIYGPWVFRWYAP